MQRFTPASFQYRIMPGHRRLLYKLRIQARMRRSIGSGLHIKERRAHNGCKLRKLRRVGKRGR